ncbi:YchJ family protein [Wenyingzhuangia sp. IMCC45533]
MSKFSKLVQKQKDAKQAKKQKFNLEAITNANRRVAKCFCDSKRLYRDCCGLIHQDIYQAKTPIDLMRSRYSAYVLADLVYLMQSHHSSTKPIDEKEEISIWTKSVLWKGLEVISSNIINDDLGYVTFKARFIEQDKECVIYEKSRFVKENNHWTYIDGIHL